MLERLTRQAILIPVRSEHSTVYVELLDEGTKCWRPVSAERLSEDTYRIEDTVPEGESWQFQPGEIVRCKERLFGDASGLAAFESANVD